MNSFVIIPAYEPDERLIDLVRDETGRGHTVVVVDDGSAADKAPIFDRVRAIAEVLVHEKNAGKGAAIKTALRHIIGIAANHPNCTTVGVVDADGQHLPSDFERVAEKARENPGSLVLGVRKVGGDMPLRSRLGNGITRAVFRILSGVYVSDTQTGLRAWSTDMCARFLEVEGERYEYETNELMLCAKSGIPMLEVPIQTIYHDSGNSVSHFRTVADSVRIYKDLFKFMGSSALSFVVDYILFCVLNFFFGTYKYGTVLCNIAARVVSAIFNYNMNCRFVFKEKGGTKSALQYGLLAVFIIIMNSIILKLYMLPGLQAELAKLLTEITLFIISFLVQKLMIFKAKK